MNNDRPLNITALSLSGKSRISKKRNVRVCFVKDNKVADSNTLSFDNINLAKRILIMDTAKLFQL